MAAHYAQCSIHPEGASRRGGSLHDPVGQQEQQVARLQDPVLFRNEFGVRQHSQQDRGANQSRFQVA